jgi:2-oxoglutarate ferredoxin oxidoreductase subunit delta
MEQVMTLPRRVKAKVKRGEVHIIKDRCKGCGFCIEFCPANVLEASEEFNSKGYHFAIVSNEGACTGCRLCELLCPDFAIYVLKE